jgi:cell division protein FtsB
MSARKVWLRRLGMAAAVALALGYVPYHLYASSGLARLVKLRAERDTLHDANLKILDENQRLRGELDALTDDEADESLSPAAVERAARDELGLVKPGELVFQVEAPR